MPRKPGGKYKGKIGRAKGEATIAAELEARRRKAYEANLARLQERRQAELLAGMGMANDEEEEQALKLQKIAQMFGHGKKATYRKFFKNWKIGLVQMRKDRTLEERRTCWRRSCDFCGAVPSNLNHRHGQFGPGHMKTCKDWWTQSLGRGEWGELMNPMAAAKDRADTVNEYRMCTCCGADTGLTGLGCRSWHMLTDSGFAGPTEISEISEKMKAKRVRVPPELQLSLLKASSSAPSLRSPSLQNKQTLSVQSNWAQIKAKSPTGEAPEYDPTEIYSLSKEQVRVEERRSWSDTLSAMAGSPWTRRRGGEVGHPALPPIPDIAPDVTDRGKALDEVTHWRTGQKTMLDKHFMKMYVVGVQ